MNEYKIEKIQALKRQANKDEAQSILERIAEHVLPICTKRRFKVKQLLEFFPKRTNLLGMNVNRGWKIYLRLRPASRPSSFLPFEEILGTMLHELSHMLVGPHNAEFYKVLDELTTEMENLMARGLLGEAGAAFQDAGDGHALGGTRVLKSQLSAVRASAAERRQQHQAIMSSGRLGGRPVDPSELRIKMLDAAEKRRRDALACAVVSSSHNDDDSNDHEIEWQCVHCTYWNPVRETGLCEMCQNPFKRKLVIDLT
ncbi:hypothetical protein LEN26_017768 [Aphanomyces euteiches]|uniref:WLM domain-containing protein n=1 Tax=Aphanomyces euteiches TaxID=100861 RepID=A0A6G0XQE8_9STRA|nr:hypothetical protein Ae201684_002442 [Aphanomyces euteiches]KAH9087144.1 hypothetical protein Ae201684P_000556 [Aphanomyces euteiches]KAH9095720.1 hypothetical protein LEN26_017768 [Aphanomyces euteiches]KAH9109850.1 hypothetical protein AeMF1_015169 [Aphanomyces euteiches]KAH9132794.1 hypothetical protein AeRB84_020858 [Aphanomyces euteiches]